MLTDVDKRITPEHHEKVAESFSRCCTKDGFFDQFYENLLKKGQKIEEMFLQSDMVVQKAALKNGLTFLIGYAKGSGIAQQKVRQLGESHSREQMNVSHDMYPHWVDALLEAAKKTDPAFEPQTEEAWRIVLSKGIALMKSLY